MDNQWKKDKNEHNKTNKILTKNKITVIDSIILDDIIARIYIGSNDYFSFMKLKHSLLDVLIQAGCEVVGEKPLTHGSLKQEIIGWFKKTENKDELIKRLKEIDIYFKNETLRKSQSHVMGEITSAIAQLVKNIPQNTDVLIDLGMVVIIQTVEENQKPQLFVRYLTPEEQEYFEKNPKLRATPRKMLKAFPLSEAEV
jgi:hypothetical protein